MLLGKVHSFIFLAHHNQAIFYPAKILVIQPLQSTAQLLVIFIQSSIPNIYFELPVKQIFQTYF